MPTVNIEMEEEWCEAANEMDISLAEYSRRMIRAGRRKFGYDRSDTSSKVQYTLNTDNQESNHNTDSQKSDIDLAKEFVSRNLSTETGHDKNGLAELIEDDIAKAADELCDEGKAKYRHSEGGWMKVTDDG